MNWPVELLELLALQQECERAAQADGLLAGSFALAASEHQLAACERKLGFALEAHHREFLRYANGWRAFSGDVDLLSTDDFSGSERFEAANLWIRECEGSVLGKHARYRDKLFPIAFGTGSTTLFVMKRERDGLRPEVVWIDNEPAEEFSTFDEMFASIKGYTRDSIEFWRKERKS